MAKRHHPKPNKNIASSIPQKDEAYISFTKYDQTNFPGEDIPSYLSNDDSSGTSDTTWEDGTSDLSAPVKMPSREELATYMVDRDLVFRLEEYRGDQYTILTFLSIIMGAELGIFVNWVTTNPLKIGIASLITFFLFLGCNIFFFICYVNKKKLADKKVEEIKNYSYKK